MTTNTHFENKEHYLAFRKAWSNAVNSDNAKPHNEVRTYTYKNSREEYTVRVDGWLTAAHHVLYNILRNRDYDHGFTLITNRNKLLNGTSPNLGLVQAVANLKHVQEWIRQELAAQEQGKDCMWSDAIDKFLAPFGDTVNREMIFNLEIPECKQLYRDFGPGRKIIPMLMSGEAKVRTQTELSTLLNEVA